MTAVKFENYITVGSNEFNERMSKYSFNGHVFFPIGTPIPIIVKGSGCPAFAIIDTIKFDKNTTTITFKIKNATEDTRRSAYTMYRNAEGFENNSSSEDSVFGVYRSKTSSSSSSRRANLDDDDDEDDMTYRPKWLK